MDYIDIDKPPYEVTEIGWGEFDLSIKIYFIDALEKPVELFHSLKLFLTDKSAEQIKNRALVFEKYDELVFNEPTENFYKKITKFSLVGPNFRLIPHRLVDYTTAKCDHEEELQLITKARTTVQQEIVTLKASLDKIEQEMQNVKNQLAEAGHLIEF